MNCEVALTELLSAAEDDCSAPLLALLLPSC